MPSAPKIYPRENTGTAQRGPPHFAGGDSSWHLYCSDEAEMKAPAKAGASFGFGEKAAAQGKKKDIPFGMSFFREGASLPPGG